MKANYHTHTYRCHHASGRDEEYVLEAIKGGIKVLGFSDHTPWKYNSDYVATMRMKLDEFDDYYQSISALREKYKDQIKILIGVEAEYYPRYMDWFTKWIKDVKLDYCILGNHFRESDEFKEYYGRICMTDEGLEDYYKSSMEAMDYKCYSYFAHPDLYMRKRKEFTQRDREIAYAICRKAKELDIILEYNLEGAIAYREPGEIGYPCLEFWKIAAEVGNRTIIGIDAHDPKSLSDTKRFDEAKALLIGLGLEVVDEIPLPLLDK